MMRHNPREDMRGSVAPTAPLHDAIRAQVAKAVAKAIASARRSYQFNPGNYAAEALADILTVQRKLKWLADLDDGVSR
jgi:hypothetical protein